MPTPVVDVDWLAANIDRDDVVVFHVIDGGSDAGPRIDGARTFDIDGDMSDNSGDLAHVMLAYDVFETKLRELGVNDDSLIVAYDTKGIQFAPRAWWMMRAGGLENVAVLDGGLPAWTAAGHPTTEDAPTWQPGNVTLDPAPERIIGKDDVKQALGDDNVRVLDARSTERFEGLGGEKWPVRLGHMSGAKNLPFTEILDDGKLLPVADLQARYNDLIGDAKQTVFTCGSGVTAAIIALGAAAAGRDNLAVYDGSWQEWAAADDTEVVTGKA